MSIVVTDNFVRGAYPTNPIGGIYAGVYGGNAVQVLSAGVCEGTTLNSFNQGCDVTDTYANNQWATITLTGTPANGASFQLILRANSPTTSAANFARWQVTVGTTTTHMRLGAWNNADIVSVTLNSIPATGDVYYVSVVGQTYSYYQNGVLLGTYTDAGANCSSGQAGFGFFCNNTALANSQISLFQAGNVDQLLQAVQYGNGTSFAFPNPVQAGSLLIAAWRSAVTPGTAPTSFTDNLNGAWASNETVSLPIDQDVGAIYVLQNAIAGATTVTVAPTGRCVLMEFAGIVPSGALDKATTNYYNGTSNLTTTPTSVASGTLSLTPELAIAVLIEGASTYAATVNSPFTLVSCSVGGASANANGAANKIAVGYAFVYTNGSLTAQFNVATAQEQGVMLCTYRSNSPIITPVNAGLVFLGNLSGEMYNDLIVPQTA